MKTIAKMANEFSDDMKARGFFGIASAEITDSDGEILPLNKFVLRNPEGGYTKLADLKPITQDNMRPNGHMIVMNADHEKSALALAGSAYVWLEDGVCKFYGIMSDNTIGKELLPVAKDGSLPFSVDAIEDNDGQIILLGISPVWQGANAAAQSIYTKHFKKGTNMRKDINKEVAADDAVKILQLLQAQGVEMTEELKSGLEDLGIDADYLEGDADGDGEGDGTVAKEEAETEVHKAAKVATTRVVKNYFMPTAKSFAGSKKEKISFDEFKKSASYTEVYAKALIAGEKDEAAVRNVIAKELKEKDISFDPATANIEPAFLGSEITALLESDGQLLSIFPRLSKNISFPTRVTEHGVAVGRAKGSTADKTSQANKIVGRLIAARLLYKYIEVPAELIFAYGNGQLSGGELLKYVVAELPMNVMAAMEQSLLVGGVKNDDGTNFAGAYSIQADAENAAIDTASVYTRAAAETMFDAARNASNNVLPQMGGVANSRTLVISKPALTELVNSANDFVKAGLIAGGEAAIKQALNVDRIVYPTWLQSYKFNTSADVNPNIDEYVKKYDFAIIDGNGGQVIGAPANTSTSEPLYIRKNAGLFENYTMFGFGLKASASAVLVAKTVTP